MPVKDLVEKFNSGSSGSAQGSSRGSSGYARPGRPSQLTAIEQESTTAQGPTVTREEDYVARKARFIIRDYSRPTPSVSTPTSTGLPPVSSSDHDAVLPGPGSNHSAPDIVTSSSDKPVSVSRATGSRLKQWLSTAATHPGDTEDGSEYEMLISKRKPFTPSEPLSPQFDSLVSSSTTFKDASASRASTSTLLPPHTRIPHTPIPLATIFSRQSAPLYLPKLDEYTSSLTSPNFPAGHRSEGGAEMFPPMDRLVKTGLSLEDLETNSVIPPWWKNKKSILGTFANLAFSITGSSALAAYYSLHGVLGTVQVFALILSTITGGHNIGDKWKQLFLGTIPNVLALNFASTVTQSLIFLLLFMAITGFLLWYFRRCTNRAADLKYLEGLQAPDSRTYGRFIVTTTFLLILVYLPISTMSVHVLVFSDDLWVVPNPYKNSSQAQVTSLGPPEEYRDPLDFCYTTTMKRNEVNWAPVLVIIAAVCFGALTVWFPYQLHGTIARMLPRVDRYTALGTFRSKSDMNREYQRLLDRDRAPFAFLYNQFRRGWGTFESIYLLAKFSALLIVAVIDADNCLFRTLSRTRVTLVRQILLLAGTVVAFGSQCIFSPFRNPVNNASEWFSRLSYVITSLLALLVAMNIPGKDAMKGPILYVVYAITYLSSIYFAIVDIGIMQRAIKRWTGRIDFSIDIFSPQIDLSPSSPHTRRRIWQESITTLLLTSPYCKMPEEQRMQFAEAPDSEYPPYLLNFAHSPAERHVENIKIFREVGPVEYARAVTLLCGPDRERFQHLVDQVQRYYIGPDCYWKPPQEPGIPGCESHFGHTWWIPFPPTIVMKYDDGPITVIKDVRDIQHYVGQNASFDIKRRRDVRLTIRALDGQKVRWPYDHVQLVGSNASIFPSRRYRARSVVHYETCELNIKRHGRLTWETLQLGSGFDIELVYDKHVRLSGGTVGINDDFDLTPPLARFLALNERLIPARLTHLEDTLDRYRQHLIHESKSKAHTLSYQFLLSTYDCPEDDIPDLGRRMAEQEHDERVRKLLRGHECSDTFSLAHARLKHVASSEVGTWWYIFWDDLWRRNNSTIAKLRTYEPDFNPHYPSSIAYRPIPRAALEAFLAQRGLFRKKASWNDFFNHGFLNKIYLRLNDVAFHGSRKAFILHWGDDENELDMEDIDLETQARPSTLGTGGGTDHDDASIRPRPTYRWENILSDDPNWRDRVGRRHGWLAKFSAWFGIKPTWTIGAPLEAILIDVRLDGGRYVLIDVEEQTDSQKSSAVITKGT